MKNSSCILFFWHFISQYSINTCEWFFPVAFHPRLLPSNLILLPPILSLWFFFPSACHFFMACRCAPETVLPPASIKEECLLRKASFFSVFSFSFSSSFFLFFLSLFFLLLKGAAETEGYIKAAEIKAIGEMGMAESWSRKGNF